jgi:hypothetical protein
MIDIHNNNITSLDHDDNIISLDHDCAVNEKTTDVIYLKHALHLDEPQTIKISYMISGNTYNNRNEPKVISKLLYSALESDKSCINNIDNPIIISNIIDYESFMIVCEYFKTYENEFDEYLDLTKPLEKTKDIFDCKIDAGFFKRWISHDHKDLDKHIEMMPQVFDLLNAANYFGADGLLHKLAMIVAWTIRNQTAANVKKIFPQYPIVEQKDIQ